MVSKRKGLGIAGLVIGGAIAYYLLKGQSSSQPVFNFQLPKFTPEKIDVGTVDTDDFTGVFTAPTLPDNADFAPTVTPQLVSQLQSFGITDGGAITNIIHGGTPCGYRGTNGKCYSSKEEAERNGAA